MTIDPSLYAAPLNDEDSRTLLASIRDAAGKAAAERVNARIIVAFDLDSTLLDNAPRQARIMREYGEQAGVEALTRVGGEHWHGWDAAIPMRAVGLDEASIEKHFGPFRDYWRSRFFASELCTEDRALPGGPEYVISVLGSGAHIYYVTGRHEGMRPGTMTSFKNSNYPLPDDDRIKLLMKPSLAEDDDAYKARTHAVLAEEGSLIAAFDNEPIHINGYAESFPDARAVHLATDHSPRKTRVLDGIPSIRGFEAWLGYAS